MTPTHLTRAVIGLAFVVTMAASSARTAAHVILQDAAAPMDLVPNNSVPASEQIDPNAILQNPMWRQQIIDGARPNPWTLCASFLAPQLLNPTTGEVSLGNPPCTTQPVAVDAPSDWHALTCRYSSGGGLPGHVNWFPATYRGKISFKEHASSDDDYVFSLRPPDDAGLVQGNGHGFEVEFDSDETIDHFSQKWWTDFHGLVDYEQFSARELIREKDAVVLGLVGIENVYPPGFAELHPAWLVAIKIQDQSFSAAGTAEDRWVFFVRNWGNEGWCSSRDHKLLTQSITLALPWKRGASDVTFDGSQVRYGSDTGASDAAFGWRLGVANQHVLLDFTLPPPDARGRIHGELVVHWTGQAPPPTSGSLPRPIPCEDVQPRLEEARAELDYWDGIAASDEALPKDRARARGMMERLNEEIAGLEQRQTQCGPPPRGPGRSIQQFMGSTVELQETEEPETPDERIGALIDGMTSEQRATYQAAMPQDVAIVDDASLAIPVIEDATTWILPAEMPGMEAVLDPEQEQRDQQQMEALCAAFNGQLPGFPGACGEEQNPGPNPGPVVVPASSEGEFPGYVSPTYGFSLSWDASMWTRDEDRAQSADQVVLIGEDGSAVYVTGTDTWGDAVSCFEDSLAFHQSQPDMGNITPIVDEEGDPFVVEDDVWSMGVFTSSSTDNNGERMDQLLALDCRTLQPGTSVVLIEAFLPLSADQRRFDAARQVVERLQLPDDLRDGEPDSGAVATEALPSPDAVLPDAYVGAWAGTGTQQDGSEWEVDVSLGGGPVGEVVGTVDYPTLGCGSELTLLRVNLDSVDLGERLTSGKDVCQGGGTMTLTPMEDGNLRFDWVSDDGASTSTGILSPGD